MEKINSFYFPLEISEGGGTSPVTSVNSKIGDVVIDSLDINSGLISDDLHNIETDTDGGHYNPQGLWTVASDACTSDYVDISDYDYLLFYIGKGGQKLLGTAVSFWDSNKEYVSGFYAPVAVGGTYSKINFPNSNPKYVRLSMFIVDKRLYKFYGVKKNQKVLEDNIESLNILANSKENETIILTQTATDFYNETTEQYTISLQNNTDIYITDKITGTWNINLPTNALKGDMASLNFTCSSTTAPTIVINTTFQKEDAIPAEGDKVEINAKYDGANWVSLMNKISEVTL